MPDLSRILKARQPLTLAQVARGAQPLVMADLARASTGRAVFIAPDDAAMRSVVDAAAFFAPELEVIEFPAWDSLPYDRASPALAISARRLAALHRLQAGKARAQLIVTTANAVLQRVLTPFRIRESVREFKPGVEIGRESLSALLQRQGYSRTDTVIDKGEYAVRGSIVDIFPSGMDEALRLDFFGDELESLRSFDPNTQMSTGRLDSHLLLPASEALLDEDSIKRFRSRYREMFGANATQDPLYEAVSEGRRLAGMEHWLPLFEDKLATLFDHLGKDDLVVIDQAALAAADERVKDVRDYFDQRTAITGQAKGNYRPLQPDALYMSADELKDALAAAPAHRATPFDEPESDGVVGFGFRSGRDFAPERARGDNVYPVLADHLKALSKAGKRPLLAAYSKGSRSRIASILEEAGTPVQMAESWQDALGLSAKGKPAAMILPIEASFANDEMELLTEQDILGDRLVRRKKKRKSADAFLAELQALSVGDLIVHTEHGIGKYLGLEPIAVGKSKHDCVQLEYKGGDKLFIPVENIDVLSRYGSSEEAVMLDRLGGEAWQKRRARLKERIREIAGELMQVAAQRALKKAPVIEVEDGTYNQFLDRFPWEETDDQERAIADVLSDLESGKPMDRLVCGDGGDEWPAGRRGRPHHPARPPAFREFFQSLQRFSAESRSPFTARIRQGDEGDPRRAVRRRRGHRDRDPCHPVEADQLQEPWPGHRRRGTALRRDA
jgi:transcription-repair coupling factor (superfamily II helicase)